MQDALRELGADMPDMTLTPEQRQQQAEIEARITTTVDIRPVLSRKREALFAHASQIQESWFSKIPPDIVEATFGYENFIRAHDVTAPRCPRTICSPACGNSG